MHFRRISSRRWICGFTAFSIAFTQLPAPSTWASPAFPATEINLPPPVIHLDLPESLGDVESLSMGKGPFLVHIQDAHGNYDAQKSTQAILHYLKDRFGFQTLFVEGSANPLDGNRLRFFPNDKELTQKVNDALTHKALVKGFENFMVDVPEARAYGIENQEAYVRNGNTFLQVLAAKKETQKFLDNMRRQIEGLASAYLNRDLRLFLNRIEDFEVKRTVSLIDWALALKKVARDKLNLDLSDPHLQIQWPMVMRLYALHDFEKKIDLAAFEKERDLFLDAATGRRGDGEKNLSPRHHVSQSPRLISKQARDQIISEVKNLLQAPLSQRLPEPDTRRLFENMIAALSGNFDFNPYPNLKLFIGHLILQSELKPERLMREIENLTEKISAHMAQGENEKKLLGLLKSYRLLEKLFALELTPGEYERILKKFKVGSLKLEVIGRMHSTAKTSNIKLPTLNSILLRPSTLVEQFLQLNQSNRVRNVSFDRMDQIDSLFDKALSFYQGTQERDTAMLANLERRLKETGVDKAVVITGGFHAGPFERALKEKGYSYALVTPKITNLGGRETYLQVVMKKGFRFANEATLMNPHAVDPDVSLELVRNELREILRSPAFQKSIGISEYGSIGDVSPTRRYTDTPALKSQRAEALVQRGDSTAINRWPRSWMSFFNSVFVSLISFSNSVFVSLISSFNSLRVSSKSLLNFETASSRWETLSLVTREVSSSMSSLLELPWTSTSNLPIFFTRSPWFSPIILIPFSSDSSIAPTSVAAYPLSFSFADFGFFIAALLTSTINRGHIVRPEHRNVNIYLNKFLDRNSTYGRLPSRRLTSRPEVLSTRDHGLSTRVSRAESRSALPNAADRSKDLAADNPPSALLRATSEEAGASFVGNDHKEPQSQRTGGSPKSYLKAVIHRLSSSRYLHFLIKNPMIQQMIVKINKNILAIIENPVKKLLASAEPTMMQLIFNMDRWIKSLLSVVRIGSYGMVGIRIPESIGNSDIYFPNNEILSFLFLEPGIRSESRVDFDRPGLRATEAMAAVKDAIQDARNNMAWYLLRRTQAIRLILTPLAGESREVQGAYGYWGKAKTSPDLRAEAEIFVTGHSGLRFHFTSTGEPEPTIHLQAYDQNDSPSWGRSEKEPMAGNVPAKLRREGRSGAERSEARAQILPVKEVPQAVERILREIAADTDPAKKGKELTSGVWFSGDASPMVSVKIEVGKPAAMDNVLESAIQKKPWPEGGRILVKRRDNDILLTPYLQHLADIVNTAMQSIREANPNSAVSPLPFQVILEKPSGDVSVLVADTSIRISDVVAISHQPAKKDVPNTAELLIEHQERPGLTRIYRILTGGQHSKSLSPMETKNPSPKRSESRTAEYAAFSRAEFVKAVHGMIEGIRSDAERSQAFIEIRFEDKVLWGAFLKNIKAMDDRQDSPGHTAYSALRHKEFSPLEIMAIIPQGNQILIQRTDFTAQSLVEELKTIKADEGVAELIEKFSQGIWESDDFASALSLLTSVRAEARAAEPGKREEVEGEKLQRPKGKAVQRISGSDVLFSGPANQGTPQRTLPEPTNPQPYTMLPDRLPWFPSFLPVNQNRQNDKNNIKRPTSDKKRPSEGLPGKISQHPRNQKGIAGTQENSTQGFPLPFRQAYSNEFYHSPNSGSMRSLNDINKLSTKIDKKSNFRVGDWEKAQNAVLPHRPVFASQPRRAEARAESEVPSEALKAEAEGTVDALEDLIKPIRDDRVWTIQQLMRLQLAEDMSWLKTLFPAELFEESPRSEDLLRARDQAILKKWSQETSEYPSFTGKSIEIMTEGEDRILFLYRSEARKDLRVNVAPMADFGNQNAGAFPIENNAIIADSKTVSRHRAANQTAGENQRIRMRKELLYFLYDPLLDILGELQKHPLGVAGKIVGDHLRPDLRLTSLPEIRPLARDTSKEARNSGFNDSTSSSISDRVFWSKKRPRVLPLPSTNLTIPSPKAKGNRAARARLSKTTFSDDNPFKNDTMDSPPVGQNYTIPLWTSNNRLRALSSRSEARMLVLSRNQDESMWKQGESVMIGDDISVMIAGFHFSRVRLGIDAPKEISVHRQEVYNAIQRENQKAQPSKKPDENPPRAEARSTEYATFSRDEFVKAVHEVIEGIRSNAERSQEFIEIRFEDKVLWGAFLKNIKAMDDNQDSPGHTAYSALRHKEFSPLEIMAIIPQGNQILIQRTDFTAQSLVEELKTIKAEEGVAELIQKFSQGIWESDDFASALSLLTSVRAEARQPEQDDKLLFTFLDTRAKAEYGSSTIEVRLNYDTTSGKFLKAFSQARYLIENFDGDIQLIHRVTPDKMLHRTGAKNQFDPNISLRGGEVLKVVGIPRSEARKETFERANGRLGDTANVTRIATLKNVSASPRRPVAVSGLSSAARQVALLFTALLVAVSLTAGEANAAVIQVAGPPKPVAAVSVESPWKAHYESVDQAKVTKALQQLPLSMRSLGDASLIGAEIALNSKFGGLAALHALLGSKPIAVVVRNEAEEKRVKDFNSTIAKESGKLEFKILKANLQHPEKLRQQYEQWTRQLRAVSVRAFLAGGDAWVPETLALESGEYIVMSLKGFDHFMGAAGAVSLVAKYRAELRLARSA